MKTLLILSALIGFTLPEKLDRTYLPPPGSKFSGGSPGAIDVPLEFPKETYPSSSQNINFGRPEISIGINKVGSNIQSPEKYGDVTSILSSFQGNSYDFPTTPNAFSQTTSFLPSEGSTIAPDIAINSQYPINTSINITTPGYFKDKNLSFDHAEPSENQMLINSDGILENQLPNNRISSQVVQNISDESQHSSNGDLNTIPKLNSYSGNHGISSISSTPVEIDNSSLNNNYDVYPTPPPSKSISQHNMKIISSTPMAADNVYTKNPSKHVSTVPISNTNSPYSYRTRAGSIQTQDREAVILNYDNTITPDGYAYSFDTSNGIHADEKGIAINGVQAVGSYSYIGDDGQLYSVNYTADENGFRPYGAHLPTAPPIPDAILKVIEQAAIDKANGIYDDGSYDDNKYGYQNYNPAKNIRFLNKYNKNRDGTNLNRSKNNNKLPQNTSLEKKLNKDIDEENKQNDITKHQLAPYMENALVDGSLSEFSPKYKSEDFENNEKDYIDNNNNNYNNKLQNKVFHSLPLKDIEKDKIMSIGFYDKTGYHYSKPQNDDTLNVADKTINKVSETPTSSETPAKYEKIVKNDDIFTYNDNDDQSLDIPIDYHKEQIDMLSNPNTRTFPILAETETVLGKNENEMQDFNTQLKQSDISPSDDQGYVYSNVPFITSKDVGLSDITFTIPTDFPSRSSSMKSSKDKNSGNFSKLSDSSLFQNHDPFSNPSLEQGKYPGILTHSNKLDNYGNNNDDDITDSGSTYSTPHMYGLVKDYIIEHLIPKTYSEDFSGPKQAQKYDPLTGYHY